MGEKPDYRENTISYYDNNAEEFIAATCNLNMSYCYSIFERYLKKDAQILDLGCGSGRDCLHFKNCGYAVTGLDASVRMCEAAAALSGVAVFCMRFDQIEYEEQFDGIWACASLLHVSKEELPEILKKVSRALKSGGILYASFKSGTGECESNGRYFNYYLNELDLRKVFCIQNGLKPLEYVKTRDVRSQRFGDTWVNLICRKA